MTRIHVLLAVSFLLLCTTTGLFAQSGSYKYPGYYFCSVLLKNDFGYGDPRNNLVDVWTDVFFANPKYGKNEIVLQFDDQLNLDYPKASWAISPSAVGPFDTESEAIAERRRRMADAARRLETSKGINKVITMKFSFNRED